MTTQAGRALRGILTTGRRLQEVVHFGVKFVFGRDIANYTCILILNEGGCDTVRVERPGPLEAWRDGEAGTIALLPATTLGEDNWEFANEETRDLFDRVRTAFPQTLDDLAEIFVGVQTSADALYIFQPVAETETTLTLRWNNQFWPIERGIVLPCLHDVPLAPYSRPVPNAWMIFPYTLATGQRRTEAHLIQPAEMARRFPLCLAYLRACKAELDRRNVAGGPASERQFYQFGRTQSLTKFNTPKIILPILSLDARYAYKSPNPGDVVTLKG